jgi:predicted enzyme related to lactoylglutathione lyase
MTERTSYEPGVPSWVDVTSPDVEASKRFYADIFGWEAQDAGPAGETGVYANFKLNGRNVAGLATVQDESQPPAWSTYVATDDADAAAARAAEAGADVLFGPTDVMDAGRMAVFAHPAGGVVGVWQAARHIGAELVNEPGALNWNELQTRDVTGAKAFYAAVFGWGIEDQEFDGTTYTLFQAADRPVAGAMTTPAAVPDEVPAFWLAYFGVEDCDATVARIEELGGSILSPTILQMEGVGRFAIVADPHGATFGVIAGEPPEE